MARKKVYKTNKGRIIDMEAMRIANERTIAAGNMNVNAKGDEVKGGKVVKTAKDRVAPYYKVKTQTSRTSIKPPIKKKDAQINTAPEEEFPDLVEAEPVVTVRKRDDGSTYKETVFADGSIETKELEPAPAPAKKKTSTKKKK